MEDSDEDRILSSLGGGSNIDRKKTQFMKSTTDDVNPEKPLIDSESDSDSSETDSSGSSDSDLEYVCAICDKTFSGYLPLKQHEKGSKHKKVIARKKQMKKLQNKDDDGDNEDEEYLTEEPFAVCKFCAKQFPGPESYALHLKSKTHKKKKLEASILEKIKENGEINLDKLKELHIQSKSALGESSLHFGKEKTDFEDGGEYECKTCEKAFSGLKPFMQHMVSKTHAKQIEKEKLMRKVVPKSSSDINDVSVLDVEDDILVCKACSTSFSGPENADSHLKSQKHKKKMEKYMRKLEKKKNKSTELEEAKASNSKSKTNEDVIQKAVELEQNLSEESDEPTSSDSEKPKESEKSRSKEKLHEENTREKALNENFQHYKKAMKSLRSLQDSE